MDGRYILSRFRSLKESPAFLKVPTTPVSYFSHDCSSLPFQLPESFQRLSWLQVRHCSNRCCIDLLMCMHLSKLMAERHALRKGSTESCSVAGCGEPAMKSVSAREADKKAKLSLEGSASGRAHLCKYHYKEYKKATKSERELDRLAW